MPPCCQPPACQSQNLRAIFHSFHFFSWFSLFCGAGDAVSVCTRGGPERGSSRNYIWDPNILTLYFIIQVTLLYVRGDNPQAYLKADPMIKKSWNMSTEMLLTSREYKIVWSHECKIGLWQTYCNMGKELEQDDLRMNNSARSNNHLSSIDLFRSMIILNNRSKVCFKTQINLMTIGGKGCAYTPQMIHLQSKSWRQSAHCW